MIYSEIITNIFICSLTQQFPVQSNLVFRLLVNVDRISLLILFIGNLLCIKEKMQMIDLKKSDCFGEMFPSP